MGSTSTNGSKGAYASGRRAIEKRDCILKIKKENVPCFLYTSILMLLKFKKKKI